MRRGLKLILPMLLLVLLVGSALAIDKTHDIIVTIPEILELELSTDLIDLGSFIEVGGVLQERIASTTPLVVKYRCNYPNGWELRVSAVDFVNSEHADLKIPVDHLSWGTTPEAINNTMATSGNVVASGKEPVNTSINIYYALKLPENPFAGQYSTTVTYTLLAL